MKALRNERGLIVNWLVKIVLGFAVVGVVLFDAGSIAVNFFGLDSAADAVANELSRQIEAQVGFNQIAFEDEAKALAKEQGVRLVKLTIEDDGTVFVKVRRKATTIVVGRIGPIKDWAKATAEARSKTT